jgi:hypothetical protein
MLIQRIAFFLACNYEMFFTEGNGIQFSGGMIYRKK